MDVAELEYIRARADVRAWFREQVNLSLTPVLIGKRKTIPNSFTVAQKAGMTPGPKSDVRPGWERHR